MLSVAVGDMEGDEGDDLLIGARGDGGGGDDLLVVNSGTGASGNDTMRCPSQSPGCYYLDGGPGNDVLTGATGPDRLFGRRGRDLLYGRAGEDSLSGGLGNDRLVGGERPDVVNCGAGRRDRAVTDRRDRVTRCERVATAPAAAAAP